MSISITESAASHVKGMLDGSPDSIGLRFGIKKSGCSGFAYVLDLASEIEENDQVFENFGVKVVIDNESLSAVDGTELDFVNDGLNQVFKFNNPNVKNECGCGESFTV